MHTRQRARGDNRAIDLRRRGDDQIGGNRRTRADRQKPRTEQVVAAGAGCHVAVQPRRRLAIPGNGIDGQGRLGGSHHSDADQQPPRRARRNGDIRHCIRRIRAAEIGATFVYWSNHW